MAKIIRQYASAVWITALLAACSSNKVPSSSEERSIPASTVKSMAATEPAGMDTGYPDEASLKMKVLTTGAFHQEEVWEGADQVKWTGLFKAPTGFYLAGTTIRTTKVHDPIVDEDETEKTGWEVSTSIRDSALLLMESLAAFTDRNVQSGALAKTILYPGDRVQFSYGGILYSLQATGIKTGRAEYNNASNIKNYKLYLSATINGQHKNQLLVAQPGFDDTMTEILFAGDIDGDKIPDFIIDTSNHYNMQKPTLYLSRPASKDKIVKPVGAHRFVGC